MKVEKCTKESFVVIGKEGSTNDSQGFMQKLWQDADANFNEIAHLVKKDDKGSLAGLWGAMSDFSRSFHPWENDFHDGLYLAGAECNDGSEAPEGWTKWVIPAYEYCYVENEGSDTFSNVIAYLRQNNLSLAGAVHDFNCPETGKGYMFFPIRKV